MTDEQRLAFQLKELAEELDGDDILTVRILDGSGETQGMPNNLFREISATVLGRTKMSKNIITIQRRRNSATP